MPIERILRELSSPSLRQRFLIAPLLGLLLLSALIAAFTYESRRQNALLTSVGEEHLVRYEAYVDLFMELSEHQVALFDLLQSAAQLDEETLYDNAKQRLFAIHDATRKLREALPAVHGHDANSLAQHREALALIEAYRQAVTSAVEMTTVNPALAPRQVALANQSFGAMNRAYNRLLDAQLEEIRLHVRDRVERNDVRTLQLALGGVGLAVLLLVLSVVLSRLLSRSLEAQVCALSELGDPAKNCAKSPAGDEVERIEAAITAFRRTQLDLRESEERFRAAFEQASVGIALRGTDLRDSRWLKVNQKLCDILGYSSDELLQLGPMDVTAPEERKCGLDHGERLLRGEIASYTREKRYVRKDGAVIWANLSATAVNGPDGRPSYVMSVIEDISERKAQQERIGALNRIHAVLSGINSTIVRVRDRQQLLDEACRIAVEAGQFATAWIGMLDQETRILSPMAWQGPGREHIDQVVIAVGEGMEHAGTLAAEAIRHKRAAIANDVAHDPRFMMKDQMRAQGLGSAVVFPLVVDGSAVGTLSLFAAQTGFFDAEEMKLLQELAGDIAFALDHIAKSERLEYLAYYDAVTGLANRTLFRERVDRAIGSAGRAGHKPAVLLFNIDRFRTLNETLGRAAGDELLKQIAARASRYVGDPGALARIGADYFAAMIPENLDARGLLRFVEQGYREVFAEPFQLGEAALRVSARIGIALCPADGSDADLLLRNAEAALKKAKPDGDKVIFYTSQMTERGAENLTLENKLREALENDEFVLHYQPKVHVETRRIIGVEALIRWQSPELGLVPPAKFIALLEETGLILEVGAWALRRAAMEHRRWVEVGLDAPRVAVNVSAIQLRQPGFVGAVENAVREGVLPAGIDLEITESLVMQDVEANIQKLKQVRGLGLAIAIDDFGTGYSSLGYLAKLPVQTLKIDRSFIVEMAHNADTLALVRMIISLAHSLRLTVVAEGVETEEQAKMLRLLDCDAMQGYLCSRPLPFDAMTALLQRAQQPYLAAA